MTGNRKAGSVCVCVCVCVERRGGEGKQTWEEIKQADAEKAW